jgi:hypothetical protein
MIKPGPIFHKSKETFIHFDKLILFGALNPKGKVHSRIQVPKVLSKG